MKFRTIALITEVLIGFLPLLFLFLIFALQVFSSIMGVFEGFSIFSLALSVLLSIVFLSGIMGLSSILDLTISLIMCRPLKNAMKFKLNAFAGIFAVVLATSLFWFLGAETELLVFLFPLLISCHLLFLAKRNQILK